LTVLQIIGIFEDFDHTEFKTVILGIAEGRRAIRQSVASGPRYPI
jgi:hypothetical protein